MITDRFSLKGRVVLVTGCKRGIGKGMAVALAEAGADIIGVSATLESSGSDVEKEVKALGRTFSAYTCDFSDRKALYAFIGKVKAEHPVIDILFNNAGTILRKPAAEHPDDRVAYAKAKTRFVRAAMRAARTEVSRPGRT